MDILSEIPHEKTWTWLRNKNLLKETESLLITTQNKATKANCGKASIEKKRNKCKFCVDRDKTINHIISECNERT